MNKEDLITVTGDLNKYTFNKWLENIDPMIQLQKENKHLQKELDKYKRLIEYLKTLNLYEFDLDYDYYDDPIESYDYANLGEYINDWLEDNENE